ncbi:sulfotransferase family protein [Aequorivita antarctica]|uniref:Sulfotransferase n=1 Tax=Aequorivita antarctica TaxID=153266 RepID=A0A5C6YXZ2_9FLAO|nr:sulfotransferase [Aequorivita antarctica]TXD72506.1 sulfotransferase [Aequorivita antarctica]SRX75400.1 hypothetical protein AEQU3_02394 [Aequorivita antarctica]
MSEENLIFIISQPRSGSTYLQSLLVDGVTIESTSEPWLLFPFAAFSQKLHTQDFYNYEWFKTAFEEFIQKKGGKEFFNEELSNFIKKIYFKNVEQAKFFLDKTPRYYEILEFIATVFPNAKIIILKRNPGDVLKSIIKTWNVGTVEKLGDYSRDLLEAPRLMQLFLMNNSGNKNIIAVKYEDLLVKKESEIRRICDFIDVKFKNDFLVANTSQITGGFGDPNLLNSEHKRSEFTSFDDEKSNDLVKGYLSYLGQDFLQKYGYNVGSHKQTLLFRRFLWCVNYRIPFVYRFFFSLFYRK